MIKSISISLSFLLIIACSPNKLDNGGFQKKAIEYKNKGALSAQFNKYDSALFYYDKAIELDETDYLPHLRKRGIYLSLEEYDKALRESEIVLNKKPDLAKEWTFTGMLHEWLGDTITAFIYYNKSIELYDDRIANPEKENEIEANKTQRAISYILVGEEGKAREELQKLKDDNPDNAMSEELFEIDKSEYMKRMFEGE